ncbi:universal stress protein [Fulvivirgaceae bacterium BMA12]|uniref:Universal stress protein n=1 Tax=Agaribacillus aureus TaxID=3051825 RepID=A0ABT8LII0_9BACT|nr:universal stress protein [Fulvivirgaceae bacterium BMA12]
MNIIKKILIPLNFSAVSDSAIDYTINFVKEDDSIQSTLLHVADLDTKSEAQKLLEERLKQLTIDFRQRSGSSGNYAVKSGPLSDAILSARSEYASDLIIMGTKGAEEKDETAITNTAELVLKADCPVLVIPENTKTFAIKNIALALGKNSIDDSFALGVLHDIARTFDAAIHILTISDENSDTLVEDANQRTLEYYFETLDYQYAFPKNTDIEQGISDYVKEKSIDMLAILPRNHAKKSKPSEGRLTKLLTLHTEVPLLTID